MCVQNPPFSPATLTSCFFTEYSLLGQFTIDLEAVLDGKKDAATLRSQVS